MNRVNYKNNKVMQRILVAMVSASMITSVLPFNIAHADTKNLQNSGNESTEIISSDKNNKINIAESNVVEITNYKPEINEIIDESGFKHPGVGLTKEILENMRNEIINQNDPWYTYYKEMLESDAANIDVKSDNQSLSDSEKIETDEFNSQVVEAKFIKDALKSYTQALLYYITGNEVYRKNAMHIIRIWSQMDPSKYAYYADACIHTGIPLNRMVTAAEILRYSSCESEDLIWTEKDTQEFTNNLINPVIDTFQHDNNHFMNQHNYPLLGAIAGYIFTGNKERYDEAVEWFTVNKTAKDQGQNGSVKQLFRLVDEDAETGEKIEIPRVQHVEMGRDQAHGGGDLTNMAYLLRLLTSQETKVDPVEGTVSNSDDSVTPYEFLDNRILHAADYFWQYMLGYETPWTPVAAHTDENGEPTIIYSTLSEQYRGRMNTANFWDIYYYYKYVLNEDIGEIAPYFEEAFEKRLPSNYYYQGNLTKVWDCVDGGGDFWIYIPKEAESEGASNLPHKQTSDSIVQLEDRYSALDSNSATKIEGDNSYIEIKASKEGSKMAELNLSYPDRTKTCLIGLKFRTNGISKLQLSKRSDSEPYCQLTLPNTNGEWRYITYDMNIDAVPYSETDSNYSTVYMNIIGDDTIVDLDYLNVKAGTTNKISRPSFKEGNSDLNLTTYADSSSEISYVFSALDTDSDKVITYNIDNKQEGLSFDTTTGKFSWKPTREGKYTFVVCADDGTTVCSKNVTINVCSNKKSAIDSIVLQNYDENEEYTQESFNAYKIEYDKILGMLDTSSDEEFTEELEVFEKVAGNLKLVTPVLKDGSIDYSQLIESATSGNKTSTLTDGDNDTYPEYQTAVDLSHVFDFGYNYKILANRFAIQSRKSFPERGAGIAVFGSNDGENWTRLTEKTTELNEKLQTLDVKEEYKNQKFRYIKAAMVDPQSSIDSNIKNSMLEISEFRIWGKRYEMDNVINSVSISSEDGSYNRLVSGNTAKLVFTSKDKVSNVKVNIQGNDAQVTSEDNKNWVAEAVIDDECKKGDVKFTINYEAADGKECPEVNVTTDASSLYVSDESNIINDIVSKVDLIDSTSGRNKQDTLKFVNRLFDDNYGTRADDSSDGNNSSDFRLNGSGSKSYIIFDFKEGNEVDLSMVELLSRQDQYYTRISGTVIEGSNDGETWNKLTDKAIATRDWQIMDIKGDAPYRYIRVYNSNAWYGNMDELKFHIKSNKGNNDDDKVTVKLLERLEDIKVKQGINKEDLDLPQYIDVELSDNTTTSAAVKWDSGDPEYDKNEIGKYKFTGDLKLPDGIVNPDEYKATVDVIVKPSEIGEESLKIIDIDSINDIYVEQGTTEDEIDFPQWAEIKLSDNTTTSAAIEWNESEPRYDSEKDGSYKFIGKIILPDNVENPYDVFAKVNVIITNSGKTDEDDADKIKTVKINGKYRVGQTLNVQLLDINGVKIDDNLDVKYRWYRADNINFDGQILVGSDSTYNLKSTDKNKYIKLDIEYSGKTFEDITSKISGNSSSSSHHSSSNSNNDEENSTESNNSEHVDQPSNNINNNASKTDNNLTGWKRDVNNNWVYYNDEKAVTGWNKIDNSWYLFDLDGVMKIGWNQDRDKWYYLRDNGLMQTGWLYNNNKWYYLNEDGSMQTGWKKINGQWYYLYTDGSMAFNTEIDVYKLDESGVWINN